VPALPSLAKPRDLREANLQDLDYLARLLDYDRSFNDESRVEFTRRLARLRENAATLSRGELLMGHLEGRRDCRQPAHRASSAASGAPT
jgi:hypothetical protein